MPSNLWDDILARIEGKVSRYIFQKWFKPTRQLNFDDDTLTVVVPDDLFKDWLTKHYDGVIREAADEVADEIGRPKIKVSLVTADAAPATPTAVSSGSGTSKPAPGTATRRRFRQRYTFEGFVVGPSNRFAHDAARAVAEAAVAEAPARSYNPLFIHGGVGLGKTHLMHAIGEYLGSRLPQQFTCMYISADRFMNEMMVAKRCDQLPDFRAYYRSTDVLLMDDIQFLAHPNRKGTQSEFFHMFDSLYHAQKQIVISSCCPPRDLQFDEGLKSRFKWGLTVGIQPPDPETRVKIVKKKTEHMAAIPINDAVARYVAELNQSNIREIEGSLTTLIAQASMRKQEVSLELAREILPNLGEQDKPTITIEMIQKVVAKHFSLKLSDLKSRNNTQKIVMPRQIAMYLAKTLTEASFPEIGRKFGKHHSTVMHACNKIENKCKNDATFKALVDGLVTSIHKSIQ